MGNIAESIERLMSQLTDSTTDAVLNEYFTLLKEHTGTLEKRLDDLETENKTLKEEIKRLQSDRDRSTVPPDFIEARGAYFLRKSDGALSVTPHCLICKAPMSDVFGSTYHCSPCNHTWGYTRNDAEMIIRDLEEG